MATKPAVARTDASGPANLVGNTCPFGRLIDPKKAAPACAYLASSESGLMTGSNIDFDQNVVGAGDPPLEL